MSASVAEYYGFRTDVDYPVIRPAMIPAKWESADDIPKCPFSSGNPCKKLKSHYEPVCSVRDGDGTLWIACSERLCSTKKDLPLCPHQQHILLDIAQHIFEEDIPPKRVCVKREASLAVVEGTTYHADYMMTTTEGKTSTSGPDRLILEMQGGGETSNTGVLTSHIRRWRGTSFQTNAFLASSTSASPLVTNAWRRQQEQFLVKGNIAMKSWKGLGIAFCVGTLLYDYLMGRLANANLPNLKQYNWTLALIGIKEDISAEPKYGPIPLTVDESRILYTNYQTFVQALINQGEPSPQAFAGEFIDLRNRSHRIDW